MKTTELIDDILNAAKSIWVDRSDFALEIKLNEDSTVTCSVTTSSTINSLNAVVIQMTCGTMLMALKALFANLVGIEDAVGTIRGR